MLPMIIIILLLLLSVATDDDADIPRLVIGSGESSFGEPRFIHDSNICGIAMMPFDYLD
jgi:hypothetical protein